MGAISILGWLAWPAVKWGLPSIGPKTTLVLIGMALTVTLMGAPALGVYIHMRGVRDAAVAERDMTWKHQLEVAEAAHEIRITNAIAAAQAVVLEDDAAERRGADDIARVLAADRACRDCRPKRR